MSTMRRQKHSLQQIQSDIPERLQNTTPTEHTTKLDTIYNKALLMLLSLLSVATYLLFASFMGMPISFWLWRQYENFKNEH